MARYLEVDDAGVVFNIFEQDFDAISEDSMTIYGQPLDTLTIGRVAYVAGSVSHAATVEYTDAFVDDNGQTVIDKHLDGVESFGGYVARLHEKAIKDSLISAGRLTINVLSMESDGGEDREPIFSVTILGRASRRTTSS